MTSNTSSPNLQSTAVVMLRGMRPVTPEFSQPTMNCCCHVEGNATSNTSSPNLQSTAVVMLRGM